MFDPLFAEFSRVSSQKRQFCFGENILKIITSVTGSNPATALPV
jgi:hypothetical protein